jgi:hypothetical protein
MITSEISDEDIINTSNKLHLCKLIKQPHLKNLYSAGILPYSIINNKIFFLLGQDNWRYSWSDFGGKCEKTDNYNVFKTASREFYEETCGVIMSQDQIYNALISETWYKIDSKTIKGNPYIMFLYKLPYNTFYIKDFKKKFKEIASNVNSANKKFLEKINLEWISCDELFSLLDCKYKYNNKVELRDVFKDTLCSNMTQFIHIVKNLK